MSRVHIVPGTPSNRPSRTSRHVISAPYRLANPAFAALQGAPQPEPPYLPTSGPGVGTGPQNRPQSLQQGFHIQPLSYGRTTLSSHPCLAARGPPCNRSRMSNAMPLCSTCRSTRNVRSSSPVLKSGVPVDVLRQLDSLRAILTGSGSRRSSAAKLTP